MSHWGSNEGGGGSKAVGNDPFQPSLTDPLNLYNLDDRPLDVSQFLNQPPYYDPGGSKKKRSQPSNKRGKSTRKDEDPEDQSNAISTDITSGAMPDSQTEQNQDDDADDDDDDDEDSSKTMDTELTSHLASGLYDISSTKTSTISSDAEFGSDTTDGFDGTETFSSDEYSEEQETEEETTPSYDHRELGQSSTDDPDDTTEDQDDSDDEPDSDATAVYDNTSYFSSGKTPTDPLISSDPITLTSSGEESDSSATQASDCETYHDGTQVPYSSTESEDEDSGLQLPSELENKDKKKQEKASTNQSTLDPGLSKQNACNELTTQKVANKTYLWDIIPGMWSSLLGATLAFLPQCRPPSGSYLSRGVVVVDETF